MFNHSISLNPADKIVLLVAKLSIQQPEIDEIDNCLSKITDWEAFTIQIIKRGMAGLFFNKITQFKNKDLIPADNLLLIEQAYLRTVNRSVLLLGHFSIIVAELQKADIEVIALKGVYLSENLYKEIGLRQFSDIDILIPVPKAHQAVQILQKLGYNYKESVPVSDFIRAKEDKVHLPPMYLNGVSVELHIKLHSANQPYEMNIDRVFATRIPVEINGSKLFALDFMHQLIHITLHTHKHFDEGNVNFTSFTDIVNLINSLPEDFYWSSFVTLCDLYNATETVFKYLILIQQFYSINVIPEDNLDKYSSKVDDKIRTQFVRYIQGYKYVETSTTAIPGHINSLRMLKNPLDIAKYLIDIFFPPKKFMIEKYAIKNHKLYVFYYPYRYLTIFSGLWQIFTKKTKT